MRTDYTASAINALTTRDAHSGKTASVGAAAIESIADAINSGSYKDVAEGMFHAFRSTHRYLQAQTLHAIMCFLATVAERYKDGRDTDGRNQFEISKIREMCQENFRRGGYPDPSPQRRTPEVCGSCLGNAENYSFCDDCQGRGWVDGGAFVGGGSL